MYTFVYNCKNWWDSDKDFDTNVVGEYATDYQIFRPYNSYYSTEEFDRHTLHAIGRACNDEALEYSFIVEIQDEMEAMAFRLTADRFIKGDGVVLKWLIQDIDLVTPLKEGTELKWLIDHDTTRKDATKAVAVVRKYEDHFTRAMDGLNGALGDDMDTQWEEFSKVLQERLKHHHDNLKPSLNKLNKERRELIKYLDKYNKK